MTTGGMELIRCCLCCVVIMSTTANQTRDLVNYFHLSSFIFLKPNTLNIKMADIQALISALDVFSRAPDKASLESANSWLQDFQHSVNASPFLSPVASNLIRDQRPSDYQSPSSSPFGIGYVSISSRKPGLLATSSFKTPMRHRQPNYSLLRLLDPKYVYLFYNTSCFVISRLSVFVVVPLKLETRHNDHF